MIAHYPTTRNPSNTLSSHYPILAQLPDLEKRFQFDEIVFSRMPGENPHPKSSVDVSAYGS